MFDKFTDRALKVMSFAREEALRFNHEYIGTEHILLGLVREQTGIGARVLKNLDVKLEKVRAEAEKLIPHGPPTVQMMQLPFTPRAKRVLELAQEEAINLCHDYIGTEHLLLGLLAEHEGVAAQVLMNLGLKLEDVRDEVLEVLGVDISSAHAAPIRPEATSSPPTGEFTLEEVVLALAGSLVSPITRWPLARDQMGAGVEQALTEAMKCARLGPDWIVRPEHLLIALVHRLDSAMSTVLEQHGVTLIAITSLLPKDALKKGGVVEFAPSVAKTMERAWAIARDRGFEKVQTEQMLVALLQEEDVPFQELLERLVASPSKLREEAEQALARRTNGERPTKWMLAQPVPFAADTWGVLRAAWGEATRLRHERLRVGHLAWALARDEEGRETAQAAMALCPTLRTTDPMRFEEIAARLLTSAGELAIAFGHREVCQDHLLHSLLSLDGASLRDLLPASIEEVLSRRQGVWERLRARCVPIAPLLGQAKVFSAISLASIHAANEQAAQDGMPHVDPTHLLFSLVRQTGAAARIFSALRTDCDALKLSRKTRLSQATPAATGGAILLSAATVSVIAMAAEEAFALGSAQLDTDHLLLGLLRATDTEASRALACVGVRLADARIAALEAVLATPDT